jgi:hypothetical protein
LESLKVEPNNQDLTNLKAELKIDNDSVLSKTEPYKVNLDLKTNKEKMEFKNFNLERKINGSNFKQFKW